MKNPLKVSVALQTFQVPISLRAASEQQAIEAAKMLSVIAGFFTAKELAAVQKALNNPALRAIIKSKI